MLEVIRRTGAPTRCGFRRRSAKLRNLMPRAHSGAGAPATRGLPGRRGCTGDRSDVRARNSGRRRCVNRQCAILMNSP